MIILSVWFLSEDWILNAFGFICYRVEMKPQPCKVPEFHIISFFLAWKPASLLNSYLSCSTLSNTIKINQHMLFVLVSSKAPSLFSAFYAINLLPIIVLRNVSSLNNMSHHLSGLQHQFPCCPLSGSTHFKLLQQHPNANDKTLSVSLDQIMLG